MPHPLVLQQLPADMKDGDSCDVWFQHEFALVLLRMKPLHDWTFLTVEYQQSSLKNFSAIQTLNRLGAVEVPAPRRGRGAREREMEDENFDFFDSPDLKASATISVGLPAVGEARRPQDERAKQKLNVEDVDMLFAGDGDEASDLESNSEFDCGDEDLPDAPAPDEPPDASEPRGHRPHEQSTDAALLHRTLGDRQVRRSPAQQIAQIALVGWIFVQVDSCQHLFCCTCFFVRFVRRLPLRKGYAIYFNRGKQCWLLHFQGKYVPGSTCSLKAVANHAGQAQPHQMNQGLGFRDEPGFGV